MIDKRAPLPAQSGPLPVPLLLGNHGAAGLIAWGELVRRSQDRRNLFLVMLAARPGVHLFTTELEHRHFAPGTPRNALFNLAVADWEGERWLIAWLPVRDRHLAVQAADNSGMRLANGVPHVISVGPGQPGFDRPAVFPLSARTVWTVENRPDSVLYQPGGDVDLREEEAFRSREIIQRSMRERGADMIGSEVVGEVGSRAEHLAWCKGRALEVLDRSGVTEAFASLTSDLGKHPDTRFHVGLVLGTAQLAAGHLASREEMRRHIEGYN